MSKSKTSKRVVGTLTTLPDRYELLYTTLQGLAAQTFPLDIIYVTIPKIAKRLKVAYPPIPDKIKDIATIVYIDDDFGPITKIYGALISEQDLDTVIISFDDDVYYPPNHVASLMAHDDGACVCGTGALISKGLFFLSITSSLAPFKKWNPLIGPNVGYDGRAVDLIFGVAGVLYRRSFFPTIENLQSELLCHTMDDNVFLNDDVLISGYLSAKNIKRLVYNDIEPVTCLDETRDDALSANLWSMVQRLKLAVNYCQEHDLFTLMEPYDLSETPTVRCGLALIAILLVITLVILVVYNYNYSLDVFNW